MGCARPAEGGTGIVNDEAGFLSTTCNYLTLFATGCSWLLHVVVVAWWDHMSVHTNSHPDRMLGFRRHLRTAVLLWSCAASTSTSTARGAITTLKSAVRYEEVIKKSRFVALAAPARTAEAANAYVKEHSDQKARHNCFAWRLSCGSTRTNGDGEPGGTAGPPILAAIEGAGLHDVVVLVTRYKLGEGALLGTGGLVRAYGGTAAAALASAETVTIVPTVIKRVAYQPHDTGAIFSVVRAFDPRPVDAPADDQLATEFEATPEALDEVLNRLRDVTQGRCTVT